MPTAILHTATRVIRRLTSDVIPPIQPDEIGQLVLEGFDLAGGPWKLGLDNVTKLTPTLTEIDQAFTLPFPADLQAVLDALVTLQNTSTLSLLTDVRATASALQAWLNKPSRL